VLEHEQGQATHQKIRIRDQQGDSEEQGGVQGREHGALSDQA
jgi:hypothetical protein